ncbi:hypothetical protein Tco_1031904 [Tanacetum coccineum]|uniref:MAK10-like protein n=1 Tax=Tanacetum coccineum TaxID=301880 RepID=A0ABQ5GBD0_9ASTR
MSSTLKFKLRLVFEGSTRSVLLPKEINYKGLVRYCNKKFTIKEIDKICLSYEDNSEKIDVHDDEDLLCFMNEVVSENACVPKLFITKVKPCCSSTKFVEFDLSVPLCIDEYKMEADVSEHIWKNNTFNNMPTPPRATNANLFVPIPPNELHVRITQELKELRAISAMINSQLEEPLNDSMNPHNVIEMDDLMSDDGSIDTPLVSPFLDSDDESDDGEVLNELDEYGNAGNFYRNRIISCFDGEDLAFSCMIGFRKFIAYFDLFLPMNIITRKAYNTIMVEGLKSTGRNLVGIARDVYVLVGSFTYLTDFVVLEDICEFIASDMMDIVMGRPFRAVTELEFDCVKGLISFSRIFDTYIFQMPRTIPRLKNFEWSKVIFDEEKPESS